MLFLRLPLYLDARGRQKWFKELKVLSNNTRVCKMTSHQTTPLYSRNFDLPFNDLTGLLVRPVLFFFFLATAIASNMLLFLRACFFDTILASY